MSTNISISESIPRPDAYSKATGSALYVGDLKPANVAARTGDSGRTGRESDSPATSFGEVPTGADSGLVGDILSGRFYRSPHARGRISSLRLPQVPEGYHIITAADVPGLNQVPMAVSRDMPCFAEDEVRYVGQIVALVLGPDPAVVDSLINGISLNVDSVAPAVNMDEALAMKGGAIHGRDNVFCRVDLDRGNVDAAFASAADVVEGSYETGFQEQFYMEGQGLITWRDGDRIGVRGSMQCPYYVNHAVSHVLGIDHKNIRVIQDTVGGAFGGKEDYPEIMGAPMAVGSWVTGKAIRMLMDRAEDMAFTSKRHPSRCIYKTALDADGNILAMDVLVDIDGGAYESYTKIVLMRAVFTSLGVYDIPAFRIRGRGIATNTTPSGAFRGFGAPQSLFGLEMHMEELARKTGKESLDFKKKYFLEKGSATVTGGHIRDEVILDKLIARIDTMSGYSDKRREYGRQASNRRATGKDASGTIASGRKPLDNGRFIDSAPMRGIGLSFINHGCGFTGDGEQKIIKAEASVRKTADGKVEILCASVDFGQGPQTTFRKVVARVLDMKPEDIGFPFPDTDRVPDSGPTVASRTMMIVGYLLQKAAEELKAGWKDGEEQLFTRKYKMPPGLNWDQDNLVGDAYATYGWGVNVCEVEVDPLTWETRVLGAWAVFDVGVAIDNRVVDGQIQGGMSQALGYGAMEKLEVDAEGRFRQINMADYMVPTSLDFPRTGAATVDNPYLYGAFGAKGMGEMVHDAGHAAYAAAVEQAVDRACPVIPLVPETLMNLMEESL